MTTKNQETSNFTNNAKDLLEPWVRAMESFNAAADRFRESATEGMFKVIDDSHRIARNGVEMASWMQKQAAVQMGRAMDWMQNLTQR